MSEALPPGFDHLGPKRCASCRFLMQYPNSHDYYCANEKHCFTIGISQATQAYTCDDHEPCVGQWEEGKIVEKNDGGK